MWSCLLDCESGSKYRRPFVLPQRHSPCFTTNTLSMATAKHLLKIHASCSWTGLDRADHGIVLNWCLNTLASSLFLDVGACLDMVAALMLHRQ